MDWPGLMRAGMQGLGLKPDAFWRLTPGELMLMLGVNTGDGPLSRARLEELAATYSNVNKDRIDG